MKPLQIGLLVLVGALGGALIMKFTQRPRHVPDPVVSAAPAAAPVQAEAPPEAPATVSPAASPAPPEETKPTPFAEPKREAPVPHARRPKPAIRPHPAVTTTVAQNLPPAAPPEPQPVAAPVAVAPPPVTIPAAAPATAPAPEPVEEPAPPPAPPPAPSVTLQAGLLLPVRLGENLSSEHNLPGDTFTATLDAPVSAGGFVIAERGARVEGRVVETQKSSHVKGQAYLTLELTRLYTSDGQRVPIQTETFRKQAPKAATGDEVGIVAAAAGVGAIIGAMAGGGKGAAIGAGAGGAAGAGGVAVTRAKAVSLPSETKLSFRLKDRVTITERQNRQEP